MDTENTERDVLTCSLCGNAFERRESLSSCTSCPLGKGCGKICCPRCGYSWIDEAPMERKLRTLTNNVNRLIERIPSLKRRSREQRS